MIRATGAGAVLVFLAGSAAGQNRFLLDVSGGASRHQFTEAGSAFSLSPRVLLRSPTARLDLGFTYTRGASFKWNAEGGLHGGVQKHLSPTLAASLNADGWWTVHRTGDGTGQLSLTPELRWTGQSVELAATGGIGHAATSIGGRWFGLLGARGRWVVGPLDVQGILNRTQFSERALRYGPEWIIPGDRPDTLKPPDTLSTIRSYNDLGVSVGWSIARTRFSLGVEQRVGRKEFQATAWHAEVSRPLAVDIALFGSAGRTLSVLTAGLPARRYISLGLRWAPGGTRRHLRPESAGLDARDVRIVHEGSSSRLLLRAPAARLVEVMGDFSDWQPVPLDASGDGWWRLARSLAPGLYRLNVRYDGGEWGVPVGLPSETDDFNGRVGVLLVAP